MQSHNDRKKIRVAITGGGISGVTLVNALIKQPHLDVHIFESAAEFAEPRGASIGLAPHAQEALQELGPEVFQAFMDAGAGAWKGLRDLIGSGPNAGAFVLELKTPSNGISRSVMRSAFLVELLKPIPKNIMHTSKKLLKIDEAEDGGVILCFRDGSKEAFDALIGADGIHGHVREHILGDHPSVKPKFAGFWGCGSVVPIEKAREFLSEEYLRESFRYSWCGDGSWLMHGRKEDDGSLLCIGSGMTDEDWNLGDEWQRDLDRKSLEKTFGSWTNSPIKDSMIELLLQNPELNARAQYEHDHAPTYYKGRVCMMGDAAHAMTPWQASGAAMAIEDAMILAALLERVKDPREVEAAFCAYDKVRRPRTQRVVESSKVTGTLLCGRQPGVGLDPEKLGAALAPRWDFIHYFDVKEHKKEALAVMQALLHGEAN